MDSSLPRVSLVVVNHNQGQFLSASLQSILRQTYQNLEIVFWDDGSRDESLAIARSLAAKDSRLRVISAPHQGLGRSRLQALAKTTGAYLGYVDADDVLAPSAVAETVTVLTEHPECGWVYTDYREMTAKGQVLGLGHRCQIPYSPQGLLLNFMTFHFRLIRRSLYRQVQAQIQQEEYTLYSVDDYDLCLRLSELSPAYHLAKPLYYYRLHAHSLSNARRSLQIEESAQVVEQALMRRGLDDRYQLSVDLETGAVVLLPKLSYARQLVTQLGAIAASIPVAIALSLGSLLPLNNSAEAQSITAAPDGTGTQINEQSGQYDITGGTQAGQNLFHSFGDFGLNTGESANFISPTADISNILGRITGGNPSFINGLIEVTGAGSPNLFLMNPAGMVFGSDASLNLPGSFTATSATSIGFEGGTFNAFGANTYNLLVGAPNQFNFATLQSDLADTDVGGIFNWGNLSVQPGQTLSLFGRSLFNAGTLSAPSGTVNAVVVPQGERLQITQPGMVLSLELAPEDRFIVPVEQLKAIDLPLLLTEGQTQHASVLVQEPDGTYRITRETLVNTGSLLATGDGTVLAQAPQISLSGDVSVAGTPLDRGGRIFILGDQIALDNAQVDASGSTGGQIRIGGDYQGQGTLPTATTTTIAATTHLTADGAGGNGGDIVVWSDDTTTFQGTASSLGGFIEISGKEQLNLGSNWFSRINLGGTGQLLLDPTDVTISSGSTGSLPYTGDSTTSVSVIFADDIASFLNDGVNGGNLTITTSFGAAGPAGDINMDSGITISWASANTLTLNADNDVNLSLGGGIATTGSGSFVVNAGNNINTASTSITSTGTGNIELTAGRSIYIYNSSISTAGSGTGNITLSANTAATATGDFNGINFSGASNIRSNTGYITLKGVGGEGGASSSNHGVYLNAGSDITSNSGEITITGTAHPGSSSTDSYSKAGIVVSGSVDTGGSGNITLTGFGGSSSYLGFGDNNEGVRITGSGRVALLNNIVTDPDQIATGTISIIGTGGGGSFGSNNRGINTGGTIQAQGNGSISLNGTGAGGSSNNDGVQNYGTIEAQGSGSITITGTGSTTSTSSDNDGIQTVGGSITTSTGTIALTGTGGSGTDYNRGVNLSGTVSAGNSITITGNGAPDTTGTFNEGVLINYGDVTSSAGTLTITGTAGTGYGYGYGYGSTHNTGVVVGQYGTISSSGTGIKITGYGTIYANATTYNHGVDIQGTVEATNTANVDITGFGGKGTDSNQGVSTYSTSNISAVDGDITIAGTANTATTGQNNSGISIGGTIATSDGAVSLTGTGGGGTDQNEGVKILVVDLGDGYTGDSISTVNGAITITGTASNGTTGQFNRGVSTLGTIASTGTSAVSLTGTGGAGTNNNDGAYIKGNISTNGQITIEGTGSSLTSGNANTGIRVLGTIASTAAGANVPSISLTGTGGSGTYGNTGIVINNSVTSVDSNINITGFGNTASSEGYNRGVYALGTIGSTQSGNITITGTGGSGTNRNVGVEINAFSNITSVLGTVTISGQGGSGTTDVNTGILSAGNITGGAVNLSGAGGVGTSSNHGVFALPNRSITATGNLSIIGIGGSGTNFNRGAYLESDLTTTNGNITITGTQGSGSDSEAIALRVNSVTLNGSGNLTLSGNTVHLSAGTIFTGNGGDLSIAPSTPSQALSLIFGDLVTDPFSSGGFNSITIGDLNSLGSVSITGTTGLNFADPLTIASKDPNTDFILNNYLRGTTNDASITIEGSGNTTTLNADITTTGTPIYINDSVILGADIKLDTTVGGGGGNITITGPITGSTQKLDIRSGTGSVNLPSSITIAGGNLTVDGLVTLNQNSIFSAGTGTIDFRRTLDTGGFDLTLRGNEIDFSNGAASVVGNLSGSTGGNLLLEPGQPDWNIDLAGVIINGSLNLTSTDLNALADGFNSITIGNNTSGNIRISGDVIFQDPTTLISGANIDTNPYSSINLQGTSNLTFSSLGSITFGSGFGYGAGVNIASADGTPLNTNLYSDSNGDGGAVTLYYSSLNTNGGNITISGGLDPITGYAQGVVGTPTGVTINTSALNAGTGQVTLRGQSQPVAGTLIHGVYLRNSSQVNGQNITITGTSSGTTDSDGVLVSGGSQIAALGDLTLTGTGTTGVKFLNSGVVQAANNASLIGTSTTGQSGILVDNSSIAVGGNLTLTADQVSLLGSGTSFTGAGGNLNVLAALDTNNLTLVFDGLGQPFATGGFSAVDFGRSTSQGTVNLSGTSSLTIADPFTLWSPQADLALNTALIGTDDASLTIQGSGNTTTLSANLITDSGEIYFNDSIILGTDVILDTTNTGSGANITITGTIDGTTPGAEQLTLNAGTSGTVQLGGAIGDTVPLAGFVVTGSGFSLGSNITTLNTSGTIVPTIGFNAPTTITAPITITAQQGRFVTNNALNLGSNDITFLVDGLRFLGGDSSVTGTGTLNLQPFSSNLTITLRALDNDSEVSLSGQSIAALADGFTQINLGDSLSGSNNFFIESGLVLRDPFVLQGQPAAKGGYLIGTGPGDVTFTLTGQNAGFLTGGLTFETNGSLSFLNATGIAAGAGTDTLVVNTGQNETIALADSTALPVLGSVAGLNFAGIEVLDLQGTADQLVGTAAADTIVINGPDAGLINGSLSFSGIESITTGDGDDTLRVVSGGSLSGLLDGGIGTDILDFSSQTGNLTVDIAQIGAISIETIVGNATTGITSTLKGLEAPGTPLTWILNSDQTGQVSGSGLAFTFGGFNALLGGSADDQFILGDGVNLAWAVDGGAGLDTLDYSAFTAPVAIDLQNSTATGLASISNLDNLIGGSTVQDVLTTLDTADAVILSGTDTGTINSAITFNSFEVLNLGAGDDTFTLNGGTLSGTVGGVSIDGGFGIDTFTGDNVANTFAVTGTNSGSATGINGFSNIENLVGGTASDTVTITTGQSETLTLTGATTFNAVGINFSNMERVEAQGVNDLLLGTPGDDSVVINGLDEVLVSGVLQATGIENLNMAQGSDTLGLLVGADISGDWSGGDGIDRLDLSIQPGDVVVNLNQLASFGIETIIGKASSTGTDVSTIQGFDSPGSLVTWLINPDFSGQIFDTTTGTTYNFIGFNQFLGGSADDRFTLTEGLPLASLLDGGLGVDRLDYSGFSSPITVNLETNTATGLTGFQNIEGVTGSSSPDDVLVGLNSGNRFVLTAANQGTVNETFSFADFESLQGGTGDEIVSFQPGAQLSGNIEGGEGTLTLEGDRLDWNGFVSGTGQLNLQPLSSDRPIYLGENTGSSTTLELSAAALSSLQGFSGITVGLPQGNGLLSGTGALTVSSPLTLQSLGSGGAIDLSGATLTTPGTSVTLLANQSIQTNQITTNGGALTLISNEGSITSTGTLQTSGSEVGGDLTLIAPGAITTGDLNTSANTGGNLQVQSQSSITTGAITTRGLNGSGGNVLLDPPGDVQVTYIDARGTTQGGNVSITTGSLFRATGLIPDTLDSISTAGSLTGSATGGSITINHNGASLGEFFIVGLGTPNNGTVGGISSGNLRVPSGQYGQTFAITLDGSFNSLIGLDERPNINLIVEGTLIPTTLFEEEGGCPPDCTSDGTPPIDVNTIVPTITSVTELSIEEIETEFTDEVAEYNGVDRPQPRSLPQIQGDLKAVEDATGVKPAIIYVLFTPTTVNSEDEASSTPEKVIAKAAPVQPNPVPEVLWEFSDSASPLNLAQAQLPSGIDRQTLPSDELELILVTSQGIPTRIRVAGANRSRVEQAAALLRQEISDPGRTTSSRYLQPSRLLYNWIIRPLETNLEENEIDNLVFVMESGLRSMPVAALHDGEQFLIEKYSAGLMPSLSLTDTRYRDIRQVRLLGMGASQFEDQSDLPTVPLELSTIAGEIWGNGEYYLNEDFTIDNLRRRSENFGIIHLATHADFLPGSVDNSYIAFARERLGINGLREFGWQGTDPETDPAVELLTLSACKTAVGSEDAELGFAGLAVQAGVKSALASLWYVSDAATTGLMTKFYEILADPQAAPIKAEALRQAQLSFARGEISVEGTELRGLGVGGVRGSSIALPQDSVQLLNDRELSHPYYWASFTLVGSPW